MAEIKHFGIMGMKWGVRRARKEARNRARSEEKARFQSEIKSAGSQKSTLQIAKRHQARMAKIEADYKAGNGPSFGEKVAAAYGLKKNSKGVWVAGPGSYTKAAATGIALGFTSFFVEMKVRDFIASKGIETVVQSAEYAKWLANG